MLDDSSIRRYVFYIQTISFTFILIIIFELYRVSYIDYPIDHIALAPRDPIKNHISTTAYTPYVIEYNDTMYTATEYTRDNSKGYDYVREYHIRNSLSVIDIRLTDKSIAIIQEDFYKEYRGIK